MTLKQRRGFFLVVPGLLAVLLLVVHATGSAQGRPNASSEWRAYGGSLASTKYSPLDQINAKNVRQLRIAWRQSATPVDVRQGPGAPVPINYAHTPLMVGGLLYMSTGYGTVAALDATTGKVVWFDPPPPPRAEASSEGPAIVAVADLGQAKRGLGYWTDGRDARIVTTVGRQLVALNAATGSDMPISGAVARST